MQVGSQLTYCITDILPLYLEQSSKLTEAGKGKHHISDFLPPEELEKFVETVKAVKEDRPPGTCFTQCVCVCLCVIFTASLYRLFRLQGAQVD